MRHRKKSEKFSRSRAQRKALVKSLLRSLVIYDRILTTESKAKAMRAWADKLITWGKKGTLHERRLSYRLLEDHDLVKRLFEEVAPRFKAVSGGYTRVLKVELRKGDGVQMLMFEFTKASAIKKKTKLAKAKVAKETPEVTDTQKKVKSKDAQKISQPKDKKKFIKGVKKIFKKDNKNK